MTTPDDRRARQAVRSRLAATDKAERPPVPGFLYVAFAVHPPQPGPLVLAIAHCDGMTVVLDVIRENIGVDDSIDLMKRYGIDHVTGAVDEGEGDSLAHAACGALSLASEGAQSGVSTRVH